MITETQDLILKLIEKTSFNNFSGPSVVRDLRAHQTLYTAIVTPGLKDVIGAALATNSVTVNAGTADRHGEYFHRQISVANTNQPVWQNLTNISGTFTNKGGLVFPANNQTLVYDVDGNLTFDGVWNYQWDGENRLISMNMTNVANIANANRLRLDFVYDFMGRRMQKVVSTWNGSAFANPVTNLFVYDGWNLLAVLSPSSQLLSSFMWGQDLSGTMTQAGGVGGLLMTSISGTNCFTAFDGNGNITALVNASDKSTAARYEYSPYGELLRSTGLFARDNPFRFSTKFWDEETELSYYGYRYYDSVYGRWLSRDSSQEQDGNNLYYFTRNSPIDGIDINGLDTYFCFRRLSGLSPSDDTVPPSPLNHNMVHEFVFTTDADGNVKNTYSWGNNGGKNGWVPDADNDKKAAEKALKNGWAVRVDDKDVNNLDALVKQAYDILSISPDSKHGNGLIFGHNCQSEAQHLVRKAVALNFDQQMDLYLDMEDYD